MPPRLNPKLLAVLLALSPLASLTSCAVSKPPPPAVVKPDPSRTEHDAEPAVPEPATPCAYDPAQMCLSDEQNGSLIKALYDALRVAYGKLDWLKDWFAAMPGPAK